MLACLVLWGRDVYHQSMLGNQAHARFLRSYNRVALTLPAQITTCMTSGICVIQSENVDLFLDFL